MSPSSRWSVLLAAFAVTALLSTSATAQEVSPRWTLQGRGLVSSDLGQDASAKFQPDWVLADFSDTEMTSRVDQVLFGDVFGMFALGAKLDDPGSPLGPVYVHQAAGEVIAKNWVATLGRGKRLVMGPEYPTLRDDDLLEFTTPLNPFAAAALQEDALYSEMAAITLRKDFRWHAQLGLESLRDTTETGRANDRGKFGPNGAMLKLYYEDLPDLMKSTVLHYAGIGFFAQDAHDVDRFYPVDKPINLQARADLSLAPHPDPIHYFDVRASVLYQSGLSPIDATGVTTNWQARYMAAALGLRYLYSPSELARFQAGLSGGYRQLLDQDTGEWRGVASLFWMLGVNVDLGLQYMYSHRGQTLAAAIDAPENEHLLEFAFVYNFDVRVNDTFTTPRNVLNLLHHYVPVH